MSNYTLITVAINPSFFKDMMGNFDVSDIFFVILLGAIAIGSLFYKKEKEQDLEA